MTHILFYFFLCVASGAALGAWFHFEFIPSLFGGASCWVVALLLRRHTARFIVALALASVFLGASLYASSPTRGLSEEWADRIRAAKTREVVLDVTVDSDLKTTRTRYGEAYRIFAATDVRMEGKPVRGAVWVSARKAPPLAYGDRLRITGVLEPLPGRKNPAGFDERAYGSARGIHARLYGRVIRRLPAVEAEGRLNFMRLCYGLKNALMRRMDAAFPEETAAISKALLLGERAQIDPDLKRALVRTGTFHLFAISGSNVALVAGFFYFLFRLVRIGERITAVLTISTVAVYCVLAGSDPPVLRATIAVMCYLFARASGNRAEALNTLGLAGTVILFWSPEQVFDVSFQLSFAAVTAILLIVPFASAGLWVRAGGRRSPLASAVSGALAFASACLVTGVVVAPVAIHYFHRFNLLSYFANLILSPVISALNALLVVFAALPFLPVWTAAPAVPLVAATRVIVRVFDSDPRWCMPLEPWMWPTWLLFALCIAGLFRVRDLKNPLARLLTIVLVTLNCILINETVAKADAEPTRLTFFDVGQGDAALFEFSDGSNLLIDAGRGSADGAERVITPYLLSRGIGRLDAVVISHPQADHCGGLAAIIREFEVGLIADNGENADISFYRDLSSAIAHKRIRHETLSYGDRLEGFSRASVEVLHPSGQDAHDVRSDPNETSVLLKVTLDGGHAILFTGDIGEEGLARVLGVHPKPGLRADILKVPHHGARPGPEAVRLFRSVRPKTAVISVGQNGYGHPAPETVALLGELACDTRRTDRDGAISFSFFADSRVKMRTFRDGGARSAI